VKFANQSARLSAWLYWEPANRKKRQVGNAALRDLLGECRTLSNSPSNMDYLRGLADAKMEGARELLEALEKYEEIELSVS